MHEGVHFFQDGRVIGVDELHFDRRSDLVPRHLLITGLGRSGTTACASIAAAFGMVTKTPSPYLENWALRQYINNRDAAGALAQLAEWSDAGERRFWKDPKIWAAKFDPFLDHIPAGVGLFIVFRDALNISARDVLLTGDDLIDRLINVSHTIDRLARRLEKVRHRNVALISYEKLLTNPEVVVNSLARFVQVSDTDAISAAIKVIEPTPMTYESHFKARLSAGRQS